MTGKPTGVRGYEYGDDHITVFFKSGSVYTYTLSSCGGASSCEHEEARKRQEGTEHVSHQEQTSVCFKVLTIPSRMSRLIYLMATSRYNKDDNEDK